LHYHGPKEDMGIQHDNPPIKKAAALLSKRAYSRGELRKKLAPITQDDLLEKTLDQLEQENLLNDAEYAYNLALHRMHQCGWGPAKVKEELLRRDIDPDVSQQAIKRGLSEADTETFLSACIEKRYKKLGSKNDPKEIKKLVLYLARRGFDENQILCALKRILPPDVFRCFETGD
jgi:regulatory protein